MRASPVPPKERGFVHLWADDRARIAVEESAGELGAELLFVDVDANLATADDRRGCAFRSVVPEVRAQWTAVLESSLDVRII